MTVPPAPALAAISHGTASPDGQAAVAALVGATRDLAGGNGSVSDIRLGHVDVQDPDVPATLSALRPQQPAVLVPLLLSAGYHVNVDMRQAAEGAGRPTTVTGALGPDPRLAAALEQRLREAGGNPEEDVLILAGAGSSHQNAVVDVQATAQLLQDRLNRSVQDAYLAFASPHVAEAVSAARAENPQRRIAVISYLLAPGYFQDQLKKQGADLVTAPLLDIADHGPDVPQGLPEIVLERFQQGLAGLS